MGNLFDDDEKNHLWWDILVIAAPLWLQSFVQGAQQLVDLFWLGRFNDTAVAALGISYPLIGFIFAVGIFTPYIGTQVMVSKRVGDTDEDAARRGVVSGSVVSLGMGLFAGVMGFVFAGPAFKFLLHTQNHSTTSLVLEAGTTYVRIISLGIVLLALSNVFEAAFIARGRSTIAFYMTTATVITNVVLDPLFIFSHGPLPGFGVGGAAVATVLGYIASLVCGLWYARRVGDITKTSFDTFSKHMKDVKEIVTVGIPRSVQILFSKLTNIIVIYVITVVSGPFGLVAYSVGSRLSTIALIPAKGLEQATRTIVGNSIGAGESDRAVRATWIGSLLALTGMLLPAFGQWFFPEQMIRLVSPEVQGKGQQYSKMYLQILAIGYPLSGLSILIRSGFDGAGRTRTTMIATLLRSWLIRLPICAVGGLILGYGIRAVFWSGPISNLVFVIFIAIYYQSISWDRVASESTTKT